MRVSIRSSRESLVFDAVFKTEHTSSMTITEHPVESGGNITDHSRMNANELSLDFGASDSGTSIVRGQNGRSVQMYQALRRIQASGLPLNVTTRLWSYNNMLINTLSAPDDYTTMNALKGMAIFKEIRIVNSATVGVSGRSSEPQKTGSTNNGTQQANNIQQTSNSSGNQSILKGLAGTASSLLGGK